MLSANTWSGCVSRETSGIRGNTYTQSMWDSLPRIIFRSRSESSLSTNLSSSSSSVSSSDGEEQVKIHRFHFVSKPTIVIGRWCKSFVVHVDRFLMQTFAAILLHGIRERGRKKNISCFPQPKELVSVEIQVFRW